MPLSKIQTGNLGRRNKIINGTGHIAQRSTSAAETVAFVLDRWKIDAYNQDQLALQISQSTDTPSGLGFPTSHLVNVNTAETAVANDEYLRYFQTIEARNLQDLGYGSSSPKKLQLTFWVKATGTNVTGTYGVLFWIEDANKYQNATYTINAANTWEKKTIEVGTTGHAAIANDSGRGMRVNFHLMAGSNYTSGTYSNEWGTGAGSAGNTHFAGGHAQNTFVQTVGNKWYMTGCQLEVGDSASDFEHRSFVEELSLCQRYYYKNMDSPPADNIPNTDTTSGNGYMGFIMYSNSSGRTPYFYFPVEMRADPTITVYSSERANTSGRFAIFTGAWGATTSSTPTVDVKRVGFSITTSGGTGNGYGYLMAGGFDANAEL